MDESEEEYHVNTSAFHQGERHFLRVPTALRAVGATILRDSVSIWEAADRLDEKFTSEWVYSKFRRCYGFGLGDQPLEDQAMFCFFLASANAAGDLQ